MSTPIPGVVYTRRYPNRSWTALGRPTLVVEIPATPVEVAGTILGSMSYPIPSANVAYVSTTGADTNSGSSLFPKATLAAAIASLVPGGTVVVRGGEYREKVGSVDPRVTIQNAPGETVWFDGSDVVTGWAASGATWVRSGWTTEFDHTNSYAANDTSLRWIDPAYPLAAWPDMVFINDVRQTLVPGTPGAGQFAVNYAADTITLGSNPTGKTVRVSVRDSFMILKAPDSILRGIGVRRYATSLSGAQATVISTSAALRAVIENCVFEDCGMQSLSIRGHGSVLRRSEIIRPGCVGLHSAHADDLVVENCHFDLANFRHFKTQPVSGAIKFSPECHRSKIRHNIIENSISMGVWFDTDNFDAQFIGNLVRNCGYMGLFSEANDNTIFAGNYIENCLFGMTAMITSNPKFWNNYSDNNIPGSATSTWDIALSQDERRNVNPATVGRCPWIITNARISNNVGACTTEPSGKVFQVYVLDKATHIPAPSMVQSVKSNLFSAHDAGGTSSNRMVGWDSNGDNIIGTGEIYKTPATFQVLTGWGNTMTANRAPSTEDIAAFDTAADVIPDDVAAAMGVAPGSQFMGPPRPRPILAVA